MDDPKFALGFYLVFLISVTAHEAAHAWSALRLGDPTAYEGGQVTLNPIPHVRREPFGMVVMPIASLFLIGFPLGFAHAPYDPFWASRYPKRAAWMALAGPVSNLLIAALSLGLLRWGLGTGFFQRPTSALTILNLVSGSDSALSQSLALFGSLLLFMNTLLAVFNLLPFPPLDGGSVLPLVLPRAALRRVQAIYAEPWAPMAGLMVAWLLIGKIFASAYRPVVEFLYEGF